MLENVIEFQHKDMNYLILIDPTQSNDLLDELDCVYPNIDNYDTVEDVVRPLQKSGYLFQVIGQLPISELDMEAREASKSVFASYRKE